MSDQARQKVQPSPFAVQMDDPQFRALSYEDQQRQRMSLYMSKASTSPVWESAPDELKVQALKQVKEMYPPAFSDPQYETLRMRLEDPKTAGIGRFLYSMDTSMGLSGLITRGVVNTGRALGNVVDSVGKFFGANPQASNGLDVEGLMLRSISGDKDGVKLAQYFQKKYEHPINPAIPLIGGATPTQLLGSALGFGTDLLTAKGAAAPAEGALEGASAVAKLAGRAAVTGTLGLARGTVAEAVNAVRPNVAPVEGATDSTHGIVSTIKSVGSLWGMWAAQDLAFGMLGQGAAEGISRVGKGFLRSVAGRGTQGLPHEEMFTKTAGGQYTPEAVDLQRRFLAGNLTPEARSQLGPAAADYARSYAETLDYSMQDPKALLDNPVAAWRVANQHMMSGQNTPLGIASVEDGVGTWRLRTGLAKGGEVLGEHLSFPEAEMVTHGAWSRCNRDSAKPLCRVERTLRGDWGQGRPAADAVSAVEDECASGCLSP